LIARMRCASLILVPFLIGDGAHGALVLGSKSRELGREFLPFARAVGAQLGQAITLSSAFTETRRAKDQIERQLETLTSLYATAHRMPCRHGRHIRTAWTGRRSCGGGASTRHSQRRRVPIDQPRQRFWCADHE